MEDQLGPLSHRPSEQSNGFNRQIFPPAGKHMTDRGLMEAADLCKITLAPVLLSDDINKGRRQLR